MTKRTLILLSGGLDSAANLALAMNDPEVTVVQTLTLDYGQKALACELRAAQALSKHYGVRHEMLSAVWLSRFSKSALNHPDSKVPSMQSQDLDNLAATTQSASAVWVPNRNGLFIEMAAVVAESREIGQILVGFNREEAATFPDNSADYLAAISKALSYSTAGRVAVDSYTIKMNKKEIVTQLRALKSPFPFELIWSCYQAGHKPCGECESCKRLKRALE